MASFGTQSSGRHAGYARHATLLACAALLGAALVAGWPAFLAQPAARSSTASVRFAVIGDFGYAGPAAAGVSALVHSWNPDFVVTVGDNNYPYGEAATMDVNVGQYYHDFIFPYTGSYGAGATTQRFWPALGNHDWGDGYIEPPNLGAYLNYFALPGNGRYYDLARDWLHLFIVDSDYHEPDGTSSTSLQGAWLHDALGNSPALWKLVFFHHPAYTSDATKAATTTYMQWPFREWGATAIFSGHAHVYERVLVQNVPYFTDGLGGQGRSAFGPVIPGSMVRYAADWGAMLVTADPIAITFQFISKAGTVIDSYGINAPASPGAPNQLVATPVPTGQVDLWWTNNTPSADFVSIERSADLVTFTEIGTVAPNVSTYSDVGRETPGTFAYRVRASAGGAYTGYSNVATATTVFAAPSAPSSLTATAISGSQVDLNWVHDAVHVDGFRIYTSTDNQMFVYGGTAAADARTFSVKNLNASTTYFFSVRAYSGAGESASSPVATVVTDPPLLAPSNLVATAVSSSEIALRWTNNSTTEDGLKVFISTDGVTFSVHAWLAAGAVAYSSLHRSADTTYYYQVRSYQSSGGQSPASNTATVATLALPPAPSALAATLSGPTKVTLSWTNTATTQAGFYVMRSTDGATFTQVGRTAATTMTYADSSVAKATTYAYQVIAYEAGGGQSAPSNTATITTPTPPAVPANLTATAVSGAQINLAWTDTSGNETNFHIYRSSDGVTFSSLAWVSANVASYSNTGLAANTTYWYRVAAYSSTLGESAPSNTASATTVAGLPLAPANLTATAVSTSQINLAWTAGSTNQAGFTIEMSPDGSAFTQIASVGASTFTYSHTGLQASTTAIYRVRAFNSTGSSPYSNLASATTLAGLAPPSALAAAAVSSSQVNLSWTDNSATENNFTIFVSTDGVNFSTYAWTSANVTTYASMGRAPLTTYYYKVRAYQTGGTVSGFSNTVSVKTLDLPAAPTSLVATVVSATQVKLTWAESTTYVDGFSVLRSTDGASFTQIARTASRTYSDSTLAPSATYYYRIVAYETGGGQSAASTAVSVTTVGLPASPSNLVATAIASNKISLTWTANSIADNFHLYISTDGVTFSSLTWVNGKTTSYVNTKRKAGTTYYYRVAAYRNGAGESAPSNIASATTPF